MGSNSAGLAHSAAAAATPATVPAPSEPNKDDSECSASLLHGALDHTCSMSRNALVVGSTLCPRHSMDAWRRHASVAEHGEVEVRDLVATTAAALKAAAAASGEWLNRSSFPCILDASGSFSPSLHSSSIAVLSNAVASSTRTFSSRNADRVSTTLAKASASNRFVESRRRVWSTKLNAVATSSSFTDADASGSVRHSSQHSRDTPPYPRSTASSMNRQLARHIESIVSRLATDAAPLSHQSLKTRISPADSAAYAASFAPPPPPAAARWSEVRCAMRCAASSSIAPGSFAAR